MYVFLGPTTWYWITRRSSLQRTNFLHFGLKVSICVWGLEISPSLLGCQLLLELFVFFRRPWWDFMGAASIIAKDTQKYFSLSTPPPLWRSLSLSCRLYCIVYLGVVFWVYHLDGWQVVPFCNAFCCFTDERCEPYLSMDIRISI